MTPRSTARLVLVSIDGLRAEFYLDRHWEAPTLQRLAYHGLRAAGATPVYPSITYPCHASIVTGVRPAIHGIVGNTIFSWSDGPTDQWYFEAKHFRRPTIWNAAHARGLTTALINWPTTVGAQADWLIPEIFVPGEIDHRRNWRVLAEVVNPRLMEEVVAACPSNEIRDGDQNDEFMTCAAARVLRRYAPDLLLLHLRNLDYAQHRFGRDSPETRSAVKRIDARIEQLLRSIDFEKSALIVLGDHGFGDVTQVIRPNVLLAQAGWIVVNNGRMQSWQVISDAGGGQASVYAKDPARAGNVIELLKQNSNGAYRVIEREELDRLEAFPDALCAINPAEGYSASQDFDGPFIGPTRHREGQHGYLPTDPKSQTGFLAFGKGIREGMLKGIDLLDVAPTAAAILGFRMAG